MRYRCWRRTAGCATLAMACVLLGISFRSRFVFDIVQLQIPPWFLVELESDVSFVEFNCRWGDDFSPLLLYDARIMNDNRAFRWIETGKPGSSHHTPMVPVPELFFWGKNGTGIGIGIVAPYLATEILLTLLSACLFLWPQRKAHSTVPSEASHKASD